MSALDPAEHMFFIAMQRIEALEKKVFKKKRPDVTMGKKLLLLREMGLLEELGNTFKTKEKFYIFLEIILDETKGNIKKYLNNRDLLEIRDNYEFTSNTLKELDLEKFIKPVKKK